MHCLKTHCLRVTTVARAMETVSSVKGFDVSGYDVAWMHKPPAKASKDLPWRPLRGTISNIIWFEGCLGYGDSLLTFAHITIALRKRFMIVD